MDQARRFLPMPDRASLFRINACSGKYQLEKMRDDSGLHSPFRRGMQMSLQDVQSCGG